MAVSTAERGSDLFCVAQRLSRRTIDERSEEKRDNLIAFTTGENIMHCLAVKAPLATNIILASEMAPRLIVALPLGIVAEKVHRSNQAAEDASVAKRDREIEVRRAAAILVAQQFIERNGLADVFGIRRKKLSLEFLEGSVAENILFAASCPSKPGSQAGFSRGEDSVGRIALTKAAFMAQEKRNRAFMNHKRNTCSQAVQIDFYVHDLFTLIQRDLSTNRIPLMVNEEVMINWKDRWWGFPDVNTSRRTKPPLKATPKGEKPA